MPSKSLFALAALAMAPLLLPVPALADTGAAAATTVDFSGVLGGVENVIYTVIAAGLAWLLHRAVAAIETWTGNQSLATLEAGLNAAIQGALGLARSRLDTELQGKATVDVHSALAAQAAGLVTTSAPKILEALGLGQKDIEDRILGLLGLDLPPIQTVATAPAATSAPGTDDIVQRVLAAITASQATPAPLVAAAPATAS